MRFEGDSHRFELVDQDGKTLLRVVRTLADGETWEGVYDDITEGWISFAQQLRLALEQHGLGPRRTIHLSGSALNGGQAPLAALGRQGRGNDIRTRGRRLRRSRNTVGRLVELALRVGIDGLVCSGIAPSS